MGLSMLLMTALSWVIAVLTWPWGPAVWVMTALFILYTVLFFLNEYLERKELEKELED